MLPGAVAEDVQRAVAELLEESRIEEGPDGYFNAPARYHVLSSDRFHHRIDALNHFLDGVYRAVVQRLVLDNRETAILKAISFTALPVSLRAYLSTLEGDIRRGIAALEEEAQFEGDTGARYVLGLSLGHLQS